MILDINLLPPIENFEAIIPLKFANINNILSERISYLNGQFTSKRFIIIAETNNSIFHFHIFSRPYVINKYYGDEPEAIGFYSFSIDSSLNIELDKLNDFNFNNGINHIHLPLGKIKSIMFYKQERKRKWNKDFAEKNLFQNVLTEIHDYYIGIHHILFTFEDNYELLLFADKGFITLKYGNELISSYENHYYNAFDLDMSLESKILDNPEILSLINIREDSNKMYKLHFEV